jgi:TPR repeat protein
MKKTASSVPKHIVILLFALSSLFASVYDKAEYAYSQNRYKEVYTLLLPLYKKGDAKAAYRIGVMYRQGEGLTRNYNKSHKAYLVAANGGDVNAMGIVAFNYYKSIGVLPDFKKALFWWKKSARIGNKKSAYMLGYLYEHGVGVKTNSWKANFWYSKAGL